MIISRNILALGYPVNSLEEARELTPAIFSINPHPKRTDRYTFLSTAEIVKQMEAIGWEIHSVSQSGKGKFNRHIVRMTHATMGSLSDRDQVIPQIVIDNSHDGLTQAMIHMGLYRQVSKTGLIVDMPDQDHSFRFRHVSNNGSDLSELMEGITKRYLDMIPHIEDMMDTILTEEEKYEFAIEAIAAREPWRFMNPKKEILRDKVEKLNNIAEILQPKRDENKGDDLWKVFNTLQEALVDGGYERLSDKGRKSKTRAITIPSRNVEFNKNLWKLADLFRLLPELV
jgi:hypothetical protein